jgi:hypothetical protein
MSDDELSRIIDRIAEKIVKGEKEKERLELDMVGVDSPHGIYVYDKERDKWILVRSTERWRSI